MTEKNNDAMNNIMPKQQESSSSLDIIETY